MSAWAALSVSVLPAFSRFFNRLLFGSCLFFRLLVVFRFSLRGCLLWWLCLCFSVAGVSAVLSSAGFVEQLQLSDFQRLIGFLRRNRCISCTAGFSGSSAVLL
jgi:hypothetical protein